MKLRVSARADFLPALFHAAACVLSVAMLLSLPASTVHDFDAHFRTPEVRRSIERTTSVAFGEDNAGECLDRSNLLPTFFVPSEPDHHPTARDTVEKPFTAPRFRILSRLRLMSSGSGGQDPLLTA
jgi:hypothetical protein